MLEPVAIPTLESNYVWLLPIDARRAYIIDPGEAAPVLAALEQRQLQLAGILITHHHWDHTDGLDDILARHRVPVYGPDSVHQVTHPLKEGDRLTLEHWQFDLLAVPGHTLDHLAYVTPERDPGPARLLFCGDALFAGGCGRVMEGTPDMSLDSLLKLNRLPGETKVYCAHEYTVTNLRFARTVEPSNRALEQRLERARALRAQGQPTLPSTLALERDTNPFLRPEEPEIRRELQLQDASPTQVFAELRRRKDRFR